MKRKIRRSKLQIKGNAEITRLFSLMDGVEDVKQLKKVNGFTLQDAVLDLLDDYKVLYVGQGKYIDCLLIAKDAKKTRIYTGVVFSVFDYNYFEELKTSRGHVYFMRFKPEGVSVATLLRDVNRRVSQIDNPYANCTFKKDKNALKCMFGRNLSNPEDRDSLTEIMEAVEKTYLSRKN